MSPTNPLGHDIPDPADPPVSDPGHGGHPHQPIPLPPQSPPPAGRTPSITSWTRLESSARDPDMRQGLSARVFDPLWMLTRQWQVGEFQGEDAGSPAMSRVRARTTAISRYRLGAAAHGNQAAVYDSALMPLEALVERQRIRPTEVAEAKQLRLVVDAGLHFMRMLEPLNLSRNYRTALVACYPLSDVVPPDADDETARFVRTMAGRAVDARLLEAAVTPVGSAPVALDPRLQIAAQDQTAVLEAAADWLVWYATLFSEPAGSDASAWDSERMEYAVSIAGRLSQDPTADKTLTASELYEGRFDWSDFDIDGGVSLGTQDDRRFISLVQTTIPAPVSVRGMPATRFWEFEDARVEYGLLPAGPGDLAQLLMIEYTSSYGNDWYLVPLELPVGSLTSIDSFVVTDTFGVRTLHRPLGDGTLPNANWSMFQHAHLRSAGAASKGVESNMFFLAPAVARALESPPVEDVLFMRDEMANLAWAIERSVEGALGAAVTRSYFVGGASGVVTASDGTGPPRYQLSSRVPDNWIPLLPVQSTGAGGAVTVRLRRGAVLQPDGSQQMHHAMGVLLNAAGSRPLSLFDEEVPREGMRVTRRHELTRWVGGTSVAWVGNRKQIGRGEGSSGLRFDSIDG